MIFFKKKCNCEICKARWMIELIGTDFFEIKTNILSGSQYLCFKKKRIIDLTFYSLRMGGGQCYFNCSESFIIFFQNLKLNKELKKREAVMNKIIDKEIKTQKNRKKN